MNIDKKAKTFSVIAGVSFILLVIGQYVIFPMITTGAYFYGRMILNNLRFIICCTAIGLIHLFGKSDKIRLRILSVLTIILAVYAVWNLIQWLPWRVGYAGDIEMSKSETGVLILLFALEILKVLSYVIVSVIYWICSSNINQKKIKLLSWIIYVPPILYFLSGFLTVGTGYFFFSGIFLYILYPAAFLFSGLWIKRESLNKANGVTYNDG